MRSAAALHGLKFHWPRRPRISRALIGFLFLSLVLHALAAYILQVVDPPVGVISPPSAQVVRLTGSTPENLALLRWIDAQDPAAFAQPHEIVPGNLYDPSYQRSLAGLQVKPKSPPEKPAGVPFPPAEATLPAAAPGEYGPVALPASLATPLATELRFSTGLADRKIVRRPPLKFDAPGAAGREPTSFMVGVSSDGNVLYTFLMGVDLDDAARAMDRKAEDYLQHIQFARAGEGVTWGMATYYWGNDTYRASAAPKP
jgi:hypothetical protein